jgi:hypothetical protein
LNATAGEQSWNYATSGGDDRFTIIEADGCGDSVRDTVIVTVTIATSTPPTIPGYPIEPLAGIISFGLIAVVALQRKKFNG